VGSCRVFMTELAMFLSRGCVLLGVVMLAEIVMMGRLMMMMGGGVMVSGRLVMRLTCQMLRWLCHFLVSFLRVAVGSWFGYLPTKISRPHRTSCQPIGDVRFVTAVRSSLVIPVRSARRIGRPAHAGHRLHHVH
jgi:hypothetical protein